MKTLLATLSTLTTLTLASNGINSSINNNTTINNSFLNKTLLNDSIPLLFNNQWNVLSISDWITNQSTVDHKFYSYDTSALKNYSFTNARNTFLVDNTGTLVYNPDVTVPNKDKSDIENTKQEMNNTEKVTTIKDTYNPYSKSVYSTSYFNGNNQDWKFIQQGGIEKHIDISKQAGADKIKNSNNLSERLGLYYIAKAAIFNKIDKTIAQQLANYFISQSSLKEQINNELATKIIDLIIDNKDIYNFIYNLPFNVSNKNYSLNYIFDKDNNLIEIYYNKWHNSSFKINTNYYWNDTFNGTESDFQDQSDVHTLINWRNYINDWDSFTKIYSNVSFTDGSYMTITDSNGTKTTSIKFDISKITDKNPVFEDTPVQGGTNNHIKLISNTLNFYLNSSYSSGFANDEMYLHLCFWRDNNNIYYQWIGSNNSHLRASGSEWTINLKTADFTCVY